MADSKGRIDMLFLSRIFSRPNPEAAARAEELVSEADVSHALHMEAIEVLEQLWFGPLPLPPVVSTRAQQIIAQLDLEGEALARPLEARDEAKGLLAQALLATPRPQPEEVAKRARIILDRLEAEGSGGQ